MSVRTEKRVVEAIVELLVDEFPGRVRPAVVRAFVAEEFAARPGAEEDALARLRILAAARSRLSGAAASPRG